MRIVVDAMGGEHAPEELAEGSPMAKPQYPADLVLVGDEIKRPPIPDRSKYNWCIQSLYAPETVGMVETGPKAMRAKSETSLSVSRRLLAENDVETVILAGSNTAIVATTRHLLGLIPGLRRSALALLFAIRNGKTFLLDAGVQARYALLMRV